MSYTPHQYITIADSNELLGYVIPSAITAAWLNGDVDDSLKTQVITDASYYFDSLPWVGFKEQHDQAYAFPRIGLPGEYDGDSRNALRGSTIGTVNGILPYPVGVALAVTAAHFADRYLNDSTDPDDLMGMGFKSVEVGSMKVELVAHDEAKSRLPDVAEMYLKSYLRTLGSGKGMREIRLI